ncbi:MAG: riboflavin biosynthesis protein RibF [Planctomycetes bacterium]|nr:riboflavin biosynthesis protein RibF [Planctomycetota bacterium]
MKVVQGLDAPELDLPCSSLTIGNFDGVHCGHQQIIAQAGLLAANIAAPTVVLTFEPHPITILRPDQAPARLTPLPEKLERLRAAGADLVVVAEANRALLSLEAPRFVERVVARLHPAHIVEGRSFRFGAGRSGTSETLADLGRLHGFNVFIVDPVRLQVDPDTTVEVSSSLIRTLIGQGRVHRASLCLGRRYALVGDVVGGHGRGRGLGFPTANLDACDQLIPGDGVYAGFAWLEGESSDEARRWPAAISIGVNPTFAGASGPSARPERRVEAHLLGPEAEMYGRRLRLEFGIRLRDQKKFDSPQALSNQIARDVEAVRRHADEQAAESAPRAAATGDSF